MNVVSFKLPPHKHHNGPVCGQMAAHLADEDVIADLAMDPMNDYAGFVPELPEPEHNECDHFSCLQIIHEWCGACEIEAQMQNFDQTHYIA